MTEDAPSCQDSVPTTFARGGEPTPTLRIERPSETPTILSQDENATAVSSQFVEGSLIDGHYLVRAVCGACGKSGMGIVYIVEDGADLFAAKTFQRRFAQELSFIQRFIREARTWMLIGFHPNIVRAYSLDIIEATPYLFMEYVPCDAAGRRSVADWLSRGRLSLETSLDFALQFCDGMHQAVSAAPGLVHRDLKPENLLVTPEGILKITDFGLVRANASDSESLEAFARAAALIEGGGDGHLTHAGMIFGTPAYMAPEQFVEASSVTIAADIYAFGCCLYEFISGTTPFYIRAKSSLERIVKLRRKHLEASPTPLSSFVPECPAALSDLVMRCLEKQPEARYAGFDKIRAELARVYEEHLGVPPRPAPLYSPTPREVAAQMRSLTLLDGYDRAIRLRNLREHQESSPYAFHLALASYFHCQDDPAEERKQLEKAARVRVHESGYEVARRLAEVCLAEEDLVGARHTLEGYLAAHPDGLDAILEPYIRLLCAEGNHAEALERLEAFPRNAREDLLRIEALAGLNRPEELGRLLERMATELLERLHAKLEALEPDDTAGWAQLGDDEILETVFQLLGVPARFDILAKAGASFWPDLGGYPDFAIEMALLSQVLGEMAQLPSQCRPAPHLPYKECACILGYPRRFERQHERDEYWFWLKEDEVNV